MTVVKDKQFDIAVFILPAGKSLPLHDHPCMSVISKVISGNLKIKGYNKKGLQTGRTIIGTLCEDSIKTSADESWILTPSYSNLHEFIALSNCVVFDILIPPYQEPERPCNFYNFANNNIVTKQKINIGDEAVFETIKEPSEVLPYSVTYVGPKVRIFSSN
jgi:cysteamine dioxygenase